MAQTATSLVIIAEFTLTAEGRQAFLDIAYQDAKDSVANEPGCQQFDVLINEEDPLQVTLYEVYDSQHAFEAHLAAPHFASFRDETPALIASQTVRRFTRSER